jgi:hypothetical protein
MNRKEAIIEILEKFWRDDSLDIVDAADEIEKLFQPDGWRDVREELPENDNQIVLTYSPDWEYVVGFYNFDRSIWEPTWFDGENGDPYLQNDVTHWMPLPESPKIKE